MLKPQTRLRCDTFAAKSRFAQIAALGGLSMGLDTADPELRSKWEELMGRLLWKNLRDLAPDAIGEQPFGAGEFRALQDQVHEKLGRAGEADDGG